MSDSPQIRNHQKPDQNTKKNSSRILEELKQFIPEGNRKFNFDDKKVSIKTSLLSQMWNNRWLVFIEILMIISCLGIPIALELNFPDQLVWHIVYGIGGGIFLLIVCFYYKLSRAWKNLILKTWTQSISEVQKNFNCINYQTIIEKLGNKYKSEDIKEAEIIFKITDIFKTSSKSLMNAIVPIMSIAFIFILIYGAGISLHNLPDLPKYFTLISLSGIGVVTFTIILFNLLTELVCQDIAIYQQCILILQEAYNIAKNKEDEAKFALLTKVSRQYELLLKELPNTIKNIEINQDKFSINKNIQGKNLFKELKKIKIVDAPRNCSTNFDSYINREESAGTDIH